MDPTSLTYDGVVTGGVAVIALIWSLYTYKCVKVSNEEELIYKYLHNLINISIKYPYLEDFVCIEQFMADATTDSRKKATYKYSENCSRYDNYCCLIFNLLAKQWVFCKRNKAKMCNDFSDEYIKRHYLWWERYKDQNSINYDGDFVEFIDGVIRKYKVDRQGI